MATLYELTGDLAALQDMIDDPDCPVSTECLKDTFESLDLEFKEKINGYGKLAKNTKACIDAIANEQRRLAKKKKSLENKLDNLKEAVAGAMLATGREKMKTELFSLYGLKVDKLVVGASDQIPDEYKKESISLVADKDKIRQALDDGEVLGFARYSASVTTR